MHKLLERLDSAASTIVPLAYLAGLMLGTMSYFAGIVLDFGLAVGIALAIAAELHAFLEQRRVRALWAAWQRATDYEARERLQGQVTAHIAILTALVAFSAVNATAFAAETWHPAPGFLPAWVQIGLRGIVIPVFFLLTGALSPLTVSAGDELASASRSMLAKAVRAMSKQWNTRIDRARRSGLDLAPIAIALMLDTGDTDGARRVRLIADGLDAAEHPQVLASVADVAVAATQAAEALPVLPAVESAPERLPESSPERPPTGPGTPTRVPRASKRTTGRGTQARVIRLKRTKASAAERIHAILDIEPDSSIRQLAKRAEVSESTASKHRALWRAARERRSHDQVAQ